MSYDCDTLENVFLSFYVLERLYAELAHEAKMATEFDRFGLEDAYPARVCAKSLWSQMDAYRTRFHSKLARTMRDSLAGMSMGEARHARTEDCYRGMYEIEGLTDTYTDRNYVFQDMHTFSLDDVEGLHDVFSDDGWDTGYGGDAWARIVENAMNYGKYDDSIYCDTIVHLVHNNGCAYNKGFLLSVRDTDELQYILDKKFGGDILDMSDYDDEYDASYFSMTLCEQVYRFWRYAVELYRMLGWRDISNTVFKCGDEFHLDYVAWSDNDALYFSDDRQLDNGDYYGEEEEEEEAYKCQCELCYRL